MVRRFDASPLRASKTPAGFLRGDARMTRVGVFTYRNADGSTRRELRTPEEVFKPSALASLAMVPITLGHPKEIVTADNAKTLSVGTVGDNVRADGRFVVAPYVLHDAAAIVEVDAGRAQELSLGYNCDLDRTPGVFEGEAYDAVQRNIVNNHLALVHRGRAGSEVRIDGDDAICVDSDREIRNDGASTMKIKINGVEFEVSDQIAQAFGVHTDGLTARITAEAKRADEAIAKIDTITARADAADAKIKTLEENNSPAKVKERIAARVDLVTKAQNVLGADVKLDEKSDDEIKRDVIKKVTPSANLDGKSAEYVNARFDHAMESHEADDEEDAPAQGAADVRRALANADHADGADDASAAHKKMIERNRNAWKPSKSA